MRFTRVFSLLAVAALALGACGGDGTPAGGGSPSPSLSADQKAVQDAVRAALAAEKAKNVDAYLALVTDKFLEESDSGTRADITSGKTPIGEDPVRVVAFSETTVSGDTGSAIVDVSIEEADVAEFLFRAKIGFLRQAGRWLLDRFEFLGAPPPAAGTEILDIKAQEYAFILDKQTVPGKVAFKFSNIGKEQHELTLYKGPDGVDIATAKKALENVDGGELKDIPEGYKADHATFTEPGQSQDVSFAAPLPKGTYVFTCYIPQGGFGEEGPVNPEGKPHIQLGMIAVITVE